MVRTRIVRQVPFAACAVALAATLGAAPAAAAENDTTNTLTIVTQAAYCPEKAPRFGEYLYSYVADGHHIDAYRVPFHDGFNFVDVTCD